MAWLTVRARDLIARRERNKCDSEGSRSRKRGGKKEKDAERRGRGDVVIPELGVRNGVKSAETRAQRRVV